MWRQAIINAKSSFGQWLKQRRQSLDLTREALANHIGCAAITIYKIEADERRPSKQIAGLLASYLNIPAAECDAFIRFARAESVDGDVPFGTPFHPPTNLLTPASRLIGRDADLAILRKRLLHPDLRLLTLIGAPGIGKTRLAQQIAADVLDDFADGVFFIPLAPITDSNLVLTTIANTLDLPEGSVHAPLLRLKTHLRDKRLLLVLDNVEQILAIAPQIADLLATCPLLKLLVTSREPLRIRFERQFPVSPLALPDPVNPPLADSLLEYAAVALFVERAQAVSPTFALTTDNAATIAAICARLDGLPLAIELISARVKLLSPSALLERLHGYLLLHSDGMTDLEPRHHTLNTAIEWSYDLLSDEEQILFRKLGVFVNGSTLEAVEAVCQPSMPVLAGMSSLLDKNVIGQVRELNNAPRFFMLETIREYALAQLTAHDELAAVQQCSAAYFRSLAEHAHPEFQHSNYRRWVSLIDAEEDNIRASLDWFEKHEFEGVVYLIKVVQPFWRNRGHATELGDRVERLIRTNAALSTQNPRIWAEALNLSAWLAYVSGDQHILSTRAEEALKLCRELGDTTGVFWALGSLTQSAALQGRDDQAEQYCLDGLAHARQREDNWFISFFLNKVGVIVRNRGDYQRAAAYHDEAVQVVKQVDDRSHQLRIFWEAGTTAIFQQAYAHARAHFVASMALSYDPMEYAYNWEGFAGLAAAQRQPERAARLLGAAELQRQLTRTPRVGLDHYYEQFMQTTRAQLDEAAFASAWAAGRAMTFEQAIAYALEAVTPAASNQTHDKK